MNASQLDQLILDKINSADDDTFAIFYIEGCPYCLGAFDYLQDNNLKFKAYDVNKINGGKSRLLDLFNKTPSLQFDRRHKTVPLIFVQGKFVGGLKELKQKY
ncbi:Hypothetical protein MVR_LOCUS292 [uncultured virus]|nr:Hypothetical protein MVR_LOCUS292 [uncultured virus]